jgi:aryl-alcohol dehydrogenase-like predicted oxidoreductase
LGRAASAPEADSLLGTMLDLGLTVVDTADTYGSGDCERLLGNVLRGRRQSFTLVTKAGYRLSNLPGPLRPLNQFVKKGLQRLGLRQCFEPAYLGKCLDHSLSRLGTDHVDAFLLHSPPMEAVTNEEVMRLCGNLRKSGKTMLTGVCSGNPEVLKAAISSGVFEIVQTPANLKVVAAMRHLWSECETRRIHVVGNYVFDPACLEIPGMTRETLMRGSSALLPKSATILCGTRSHAHLRQSYEWARAPLPQAEAERIAKELASVK